MYSLWYAYFIYKNNNVKFGDIPFLRKPPSEKVSGSGSTPAPLKAAQPPPKAAQPPPSAPIRTPSTPKDIPGRSPPVQAPVPPPAAVKKAPPPVKPTNRFLPGQTQSISDHLNACISAIVRKNAVEQQAAIEAFVRTAGYLESDQEKQELEERVRTDLANKDRELAEALDQCLKEAGKEAEEIAVKHAREAFDKVTNKFNDEMAAASAKVAADNAAAKEASTLGSRIREVAERTAMDEYVALEDCVKSADALLSSENQAAALEKCLQSAAARKAAADSSAMASILEESRKRITAEEDGAREALLQDLREKEKAEVAEIELCVKEATAKKVAEETIKIEQLYKKKAQETLALADAEVDLCVKNVGNVSSAGTRSNLEASIKRAAKKKADTDAATIEALVAAATKNIEEEELAAIHICTQRAMNKLKEDGAGPSGHGKSGSDDSRDKAGIGTEPDDASSKSDLRTSEGKNKSKSRPVPRDDGTKSEPSGKNDSIGKSKFVPGEEDVKIKTSVSSDNDDSTAKTGLISKDGDKKADLPPGQDDARSTGKSGITTGKEDVRTAGRTTRVDDATSKSGLTLGTGASRCKTELTPGEVEIGKKVGLSSESDDVSRVTVGEDEARYKVEGQKMDQNSTSKQFTDDHGKQGTTGQYVECRKAVKTTDATRKYNSINPQTQKAPKVSDQLPATGHWVNGKCVRYTETPTRNDDESETSATKGEEEASTSDLPRVQNECVREVSKQVSAQKKTPRTQVTVQKENDIAKRTPTSAAGKNDTPRIENECTDETPKEASAQKKTSRPPETVLKNYESATEPPSIVADLDDVSEKYSTPRESTGDMSLASARSSKSFASACLEVELMLEDSSEEEKSKGTRLDGKLVSYGVQVTGEMCSEEDQTLRTKSDVNAEVLKTENETRSMEVQTTNDRLAQGTQLLDLCFPEDETLRETTVLTDAEETNTSKRETSSAASEVDTEKVQDKDDTRLTEAQTTDDDRSTRENQVIEWCVTEDETLQGTTSSAGQEADTLAQENLSALKPVSQTVSREGSEDPSSVYSQLLQRMTEECDNEEELSPEESAMCEAMTRAAKLRGLKKSRPCAESENLERRATELETLVAEMVSSQQSQRNPDVGVPKKINTVSASRVASKVASSQSKMAEEAVDIECLVAETCAICKTKVEAGRLREAAARSDSPEERKCLERAATEREARANMLEHSVATKRESKARKVMNEGVAFKEVDIVANLQPETARFEREAGEREIHMSLRRTQIEATRLREAAKLAQSSEERRCLDQAAQEREAVVNNICGTPSILSKTPSGGDVTEKQASIARQGTRRLSSKKESHGPKGNMRPSSTTSCVDSLRKEQVPRRPDQKSFSCTCEALVNQPSHEDNAKKRPTELPIKQQSTACLTSRETVVCKEDNSLKRSQSHPLAMKPSSTGEADDEKGRADCLEQCNFVSKLPSSVTKRQCRTLAEWKKEGCAKSKITEARDSKVPERESKMSPASFPDSRIDGEVEPKLSGNLPEPGRYTFCVRAITESVDVRTGTESFENIENSDSKTVSLSVRRTSDQVEEVRNSSSEPNGLPMFVKLASDGKELYVPRPHEEKTCLPAPESEHASASVLTNEEESMIAAIPLTSSVTASPRSSQEKVSSDLLVTPEPSTICDKEKTPENSSQKFLQMESSSSPHRSRSNNSRSEDNLLHETAADIISACSGECSKLSYQALMDTVEESCSQKYVDGDNDTLDDGKVIERGKSVKNCSEGSQNNRDHTPDFAAKKNLQERVSVASDDTEMLHRTVSSMSEAVMPSKRSVRVPTEPSSSGNIPTDSLFFTETCVQKHEVLERQKTRSESPFSDTSKSAFVPSYSVGKMDVPSHKSKKAIILRQSTSALSFPVEDNPSNLNQSSKSEHDLIVEDVILAVEATARHAARAAAARDRAFEAAGVAVRAVASEDVSAARQAVQMSRAAAEAAVEQAARAARESIKAVSLATTSKCSRRASALASASALAAQQDSVAAGRFFSHAADALRCLEVSDSSSQDDRLAAATFKQVITSAVNTNDAAVKAKAHLADAVSAAEAVEGVVAHLSQTNVDIVKLEQAAAVAANDAADAAAQALEEAETVARASKKARKIASASCRSAFAASAARHSSTSADSAKIKAAAASEAAVAARTYAQQARDAVAVITSSTVSETAKMAACSAALVAAAKTAAARSASECSQAKAAASDAAAQIYACIPTDCLCISLTGSTKLRAFALAKTAEAEAAANRAAENASDAATQAARAKAISLNVQELVAQDDVAAVAGRYATAAAREASRLAYAAAEDAEAASNEVSMCRNAAANVRLHMPPKQSAESVVQIKSASQCSFETEIRSSTSPTSKARHVTLPEPP